MNEITTTQIAVGSMRIFSLRAPLLVIGRGIGSLLMACGRGFVDLSKAYARVLEIAYVEPFRISAQRQRPAPDADLKNRNPNW